MSQSHRFFLAEPTCNATRPCSSDTTKVQFCKVGHRHLLALLEAQMEHQIACVDEMGTQYAQWPQLHDFLPASTKRFKQRARIVALLVL